MLLAGIGPLGPIELGLILLIVILIFGAGRLPEVGGAVGKSIREFRKATKDGDEEKSEKKDATMTASAPPPAAPVNGATTAASSDTMFCGECGTSNPRSAKFCANCGHALHAPVS